MSGDPGNRSESGSEEGEHRQLANGIKNQRITKAQDRILNRMAKFTKRMLLGGLRAVVVALARGSLGGVRDREWRESGDGSSYAKKTTLNRG